MDKDVRIKKRAAVVEQYPLNLIQAINEHCWHCPTLPTDDITPQMREGLHYSLASLIDREQLIIRLRYQERQTLATIGAELGVTGERVRTLINKTLRKLASPPLLGYIKYGKDEYERLLAKAEENRQIELKNKLQLTVEELDLTVRSFNCLIKRGCNIVADIVKLTEDEIVNTKNLGMRSVTEIANKLQEIGIIGSEWDAYASKKEKEK